MRTSLPLLCATALAALSCSSDGSETPRPLSVEPATGLASTTTRVVIRGDGFLARPSEQQSGGAVIDARHRAWLDDAELGEVTWIDAHTLEAIVPAGLPAGAKRLLVENAFGQRGALDGAFTVIGGKTQTPAALAATLAVEGSPTTVLVGQALNVTLTVTNTGESGANVTRVTPSPVGACSAPSPAPPQVLAGLGSVTYTWTCTALAAGELTLGASVAGVAASNGAGLQANAPGVVLTVQLPAELTATIGADPSTASVGQPVTATFTVTNGGSAANITTITRNTSGAGTTNADCTAVNPAVPISIPAGATQPFIWTCTPGADGTLSLSGTAIGTDAVSGASLSATSSPASVTVLRPAAVSATLVADPASANVGQPVTLTLTVANQGQASANVTEVIVGPVAAATCTAPSPAAPQTVPGGGTIDFTWTCTPTAEGTLTISATVSAVDANSGSDASPAVPPVDVTVQPPAALTATLTSSASTVPKDKNTPVALTLQLRNGAQGWAHVTSITPTKTGNVLCDAPGPLPQDVGPDATATFGWSCTVNKTTTLGATVTATDLDTGTPLTVTVPTVVVTAI